MSETKRTDKKDITTEASEEASVQITDVVEPIKESIMEEKEILEEKNIPIAEAHYAEPGSSKPIIMSEAVINNQTGESRITYTGPLEAEMVGRVTGNLSISTEHPRQRESGWRRLLSGCKNHNAVDENAHNPTSRSR